MRLHLNLIYWQHLVSESNAVCLFGMRNWFGSIVMLTVWCTFGTIEFVFQWDGLISATWHEFQILHRVSIWFILIAGFLYWIYRVPEWIFSVSLFLHLKTILQSLQQSSHVPIYCYWIRECKHIYNYK